MRTARCCAPSSPRAPRGSQPAEDAGARPGAAFGALCGKSGEGAATRRDGLAKELGASEADAAEPGKLH